MRKYSLLLVMIGAACLMGCGESSTTDTSNTNTSAEPKVAAPPATEQPTAQGQMSTPATAP